MFHRSYRQQHTSLSIIQNKMYCHDVSLYDCLSRSWFYPSNSQVLKDLKDPWDYPVIANASILY